MKYELSDLFNIIINPPDANSLLNYYNHPQFYTYLQNIGNSILQNFNNSDLNQLSLEQLSKDLNIKILIYTESSLYLETFSYEFMNPPTIYIYAVKQGDRFIYPYIFQPVNRLLLTPLVTLPGDSLKILNKLGVSLTSQSNTILTKKDLLKGVKVAIRDFKMIQNEFTFIHNALQIKERAGPLPILRTSNMNINELKESKSYQVRFPEFFSKFVPVPDLNIIEESRKEGVKPEEDSDEEFVASDEDEPDIEEKDIPPGNAGIDDPGIFQSFTGNSAQTNPPSQPNSVPANPSNHNCIECRNEPWDLVRYDCGCALCQSCIIKSYYNGTCEKCKRQLTDNDKEATAQYI